MNDLNQKWESLKGKASQRRQDLEDSLQAQQYFADANEAESWMREKEPIVGSTDYGKDEDSAEVCCCLGLSLSGLEQMLLPFSWRGRAMQMTLCVAAISGRITTTAPAA